jgi:hypothetical protein
MKKSLFSLARLGILGVLSLAAFPALATAEVRTIEIDVAGYLCGL